MGENTPVFQTAEQNGKIDKDKLSRQPYDMLLPLNIVRTEPQPVAPLKG